LNPLAQALARLIPLAAALLLIVGSASAADSAQPPAKVRVAAVQFISRWASPSENRKALAPFVREAAKNGAKIVVLPETGITGYMSHDIRLTWQVDHLLYSIAWVDEPKSDWFTRRLPEIARKANVNIIGANWSIPDQAGWSGYGRSLILLRDGRTAAKVKNDLGNEIIYADLDVPPRH